MPSDVDADVDVADVRCDIWGGGSFWVYFLVFFGYFFGFLNPKP